MRAGHRADAVERIMHVRDPVAQRFIHGVLERPRARLHRDHLGAEHLHTNDVCLLPVNVNGAHVDKAFKPEARA